MILILLQTVQSDFKREGHFILITQNTSPPPLRSQKKNSQTQNVGLNYRPLYLNSILKWQGEKLTNDTKEQGSTWIPPLLHKRLATLSCLSHPMVACTQLAQQMVPILKTQFPKLHNLRGG